MEREHCLFLDTLGCCWQQFNGCAKPYKRTHGAFIDLSFCQRNSPVSNSQLPLISSFALYEVDVIIFRSVQLREVLEKAKSYGNVEI